MKIKFLINTNHITDAPMINTLQLKVNGKEVTLDRFDTEYTFTDTDTSERKLDMYWRNVYVWDGEDIKHCEIKSTDKIEFIELEVEDDIIQDDVYYKPTEIILSGLEDCGSVRLAVA